MNTQPGSLDAAPVRDYLLGLQARIVAALEQAGGNAFRADDWQRPEGGGLDVSPHAAPDGLLPPKGAQAALGRPSGGLARLIEGGQLFERGAVLFSHVCGTRLPPSASAHRPELSGRSWEAMGVSMVLHPRNPYVPTAHMNVRMFRALARPEHGESDAFWFGGGLDLTPYYAFEEDARHFHRVCRDALAPFGADCYPRYKRWCDEYFFLKHRNEARGIGGVFYDDLCEPGFEASFALTRAVGDCFLDAYLPIVERRCKTPYGERERDFQAYRRGRYVEFNLVYDRGTLFGLQSGGRTESILLSMPPIANWRYDWQPEPDTPEARLQGFLVPRDWV